jgi:hypothetical protein
METRNSDAVGEQGGLLCGLGVPEKFKPVRERAGIEAAKSLGEILRFRLFLTAGGVELYARDES